MSCENCASLSERAQELTQQVRKLDDELQADASHMMKVHKELEELRDDETWAQTVHNGIQYRADWGAGVSGWKPSIHMPRVACRLVLEVTGVRVERVQDISEADARAEGIIGGLSESGTSGWGSGEGMPDVYKARWGFKALWDTMRAETEFSWEKNPWVWVIDFNRCVSPKVTNDG